MEFIIAYGFYKINKIAAAELMNGAVKVEKTEKINKVIRALENGLITVDEAANAIANA